MPNRYYYAIIAFTLAMAVLAVTFFLDGAGAPDMVGK